MACGLVVLLPSVHLPFPVPFPQRLVYPVQKKAFTAPVALAFLFPIPSRAGGSIAVSNIFKVFLRQGLRGKLFDMPRNLCLKIQGNEELRHERKDLEAVTL